MGEANRITNAIKIVSLLQPPPETVANFDELVVLSEGMVIYSGPLDDVIEYFNSVGYEIPERMDVADWLQVRATICVLVYCSDDSNLTVSLLLV